MINDSLGGLRFGINGEGNYGYFGADDSLIPFSSGIYKFSYQYSKMSSIIASQDLSFTIDSTRKYKVIPICAGNGYATPSISIEKNGSNIKTITGTGNSSIDTTEFELELAHGDSIKAVFPVGTTNAATFAGLIFY